MTFEANFRARSAHEHAWQLLPWFVTARVSADDAQRIERHLETCAECRAELETQRELSAAFRADEPVMLAPQASLQKLLSRIDASTPDAAVFESEPYRAPKPRTHRWLAIAAAVQAIAIGALLVVLWQQFDERLHAPRFSTMTSSADQSASGAILRIVFRPETPATDLQRVVRSIDAEIVSGPTEAGVYTLRLHRTASDAQVAETLSRIRREHEVVFAEHVLPERAQ